MYYLGIVAFFALTVGCSCTLLVNDNGILPPLYEMDDFRLCQKESGLYCKFILQVVPNNNDNAVWKIMKKTKEDPLIFRRDIFYRYKCVPNNLKNNEEIAQMAIKEENGKLENVSLTVQITDTICRKFDRTSLSSDDKIFLYILVIYVTIVMAATFYHIKMQNANQSPAIKANEYFLCFSIKRNWEKFLQQTSYTDYVRLRSFQGLKALGMLKVIFGHTMMSLIPIATTNPEVFENIFKIPFCRVLLNFGMNFIQVFFLISAWLLANGVVSTYYNRNNATKFTIGDILKDVAFRYGRLIGPLALFVGFSRTSLYKVFERGPQGGHIHINHEICKRNAWATLFFLNNHYYSYEQCYFITWFLSADFQFFLATLALVYFALKYQINAKRILQIVLFVFGIDWIYNAFVIYKYGFSASVGTSPEKSKLETSLSSYETFAMHTSLYINFGGYVIGLFAGVLYNQFKDKEVKCANVLLKLSLITPLAVFLSIFDHSPMLNGILGASLKPLFNIGSSCLVFGLVFSKENGGLKKFFEWKYFEYLAKLGYSVYLSHYWICFGREMIFDKIIELSYLKIAVFYLMDIILSVIFGLVVFILFECPTRGLLGLLAKKSVQKSPKIKNQ